MGCNCAERRKLLGQAYTAVRQGEIKRAAQQVAATAKSASSDLAALRRAAAVRLQPRLPRR